MKQKTLKLKHAVWSLLALGLVAVGLVSCATNPKISRAHAGEIALAQVPGGQIKGAELEREFGLLVWSVDMATPGSPDITEVLIYANSGIIMKTKTEMPDQEAEEAKKKK